MGQGFTHSLGGLATCRALMGFFESGFVPGLYPYMYIFEVVF